MAKKKSTKKQKNTSSGAGGNDGGGMMVDPACIRFQHARIRPFFSGCGRRVEDTLEEIRQGEMQPSDLPPIQVLVGPMDEKTGEPWYFSLNNRRLWVLKRCREEGLLSSTHHRIYVRVRKPKSEQELQRYTVENCALEAKIMSEKPAVPLQKGDGKQGTVERNDQELRTTSAITNAHKLHNDGQVDFATKEFAQQLSLNDAEADDSDSDSSDDDNDEPSGPSNRFSALF